MKKITAILLLIIITLSLFAGCGRETGTETSAVPTETEVPAETLSPLPEVDADPLIWRVTDKEGHTMYLFGTIHVGDERNESVAYRVDKILSSCDALALEFDPVAYQNDLSAAIEDLQSYLYADGTTVKDHVPEELYEKMTSVLEDAGFMPAMFENYSLAMWNQLIESIYVDRSAYSTEFAMDSLLAERAYDLSVPVLEVESASFQTSLLASFPEELYVLMTEELLDTTYEEYGESVDELFTAWVSGDEEAIVKINEGEDSEETEDYTEEQIKMIEEYNRKLLGDRNRGMADKAAEYIESGDTVFFAVGTAHFVGDAGIVSLLREAGYTVERISINDN